MELTAFKIYDYTGRAYPTRVEYCGKYGQYYIFRHLCSTAIFDLSEKEVEIFIG